MYGVEYLREFDPKDADHIARRLKLCELPSGPKLLPDAFDCILARVSGREPCSGPLFALIAAFSVAHKSQRIHRFYTQILHRTDESLNVVIF